MVIAAIAWFVYAHYERGQLMNQYGEKLRAYNAGAFKEIVQDSGDPHYEIVTRLAVEMQSSKGQKAILIKTNGAAIHHINQNGTFAAKGPYFISGYTRNWNRTGVVHLVKVMRGKGGRGFPPDHYNQTGAISERGIEIVEYNTRRYPPMDIREFVDKKIKPQ